MYNHSLVHHQIVLGLKSTNECHNEHGVVLDPSITWWSKYNSDTYYNTWCEQFDKVYRFIEYVFSLFEGKYSGLPWKSAYVIRFYLKRPHSKTTMVFTTNMSIIIPMSSYIYSVTDDGCVTTQEINVGEEDIHCGYTLSLMRFIRFIETHASSLHVAVFKERGGCIIDDTEKDVVAMIGAKKYDLFGDLASYVVPETDFIRYYRNDVYLVNKLLNPDICHANYYERQLGIKVEV